MNAIKFDSLSHIKWKSMMITDKAVILSTKQYVSLESMAKNLRGTGVLEDKEEFWYQSLEEMSYLTNGENLTLKKLDYRRNSVSTTLNVGDIDTINELVRAMSQNEEFTRSEEKASMFSVVKSSLIRIPAAAGFTALMYFVANDMASGKDIDTSGRRSLYKKIMVGIIDLIGATGVLILGGAITLFFIYQLVQNLKNPPTLIRMKRVSKGS